MNWEKRGQVTIWVIVAIAIVAVMSLIFFISGGPTLITGPEINPQAYLDKCMKDAAEDALGIMLPQGGFIQPKSSKIHDDINVTYLCYTDSYYFPCINQHPAYISELREEILNYVKPKTEQCFNDMKSALEKKDYSVTFNSPLTMEIGLVPDKVKISAERDVVIKKQEETRTFKNFESEVISPLYNLANVAIEAVNSDIKYCGFAYVGYMVLHPEFDIRLDRMSDATKIYTIKDIKSGKELNIAIKGCVSVPGK